MQMKVPPPILLSLDIYANLGSIDIALIRFQLGNEARQKLLDYSVSEKLLDQFMLIQ